MTKSLKSLSEAKMVLGENQLLLLRTRSTDGKNREMFREGGIFAKHQLSDPAEHYCYQQSLVGDTFSALQQVLSQIDVYICDVLVSSVAHFIVSWACLYALSQGSISI